MFQSNMYKSTELYTRSSLANNLALKNIVLEATAFAINEMPTYQVVQEIKSLDGIDAGAISRSIDAIQSFYQIASNNFLCMRKPNVTSSPFGEVVFEWWNKERKLTVYACNEGLNYLKVWGPDMIEEMEDGAFSLTTPYEVFSWLES
jgi:hypothetical protein